MWSVPWIEPDLCLTDISIEFSALENRPLYEAIEPVVRYHSHLMKSPDIQENTIT